MILGVMDFEVHCFSEVEIVLQAVQHAAVKMNTETMKVYEE